MLAAALAIGFALAATAPSATTAPPAWAAWKTPLTPSQYAAKREGLYLTGFPLINYDPDRGTGYGARLYVFENGSRGDPLFRYSPYFHRVYLQFYQTTAGFASHAIKWDAPYLFGSRYRVRSALAYERDVDANYFGAGARTLGRLHVDGRRFDTFAAYERYLERVRGGVTLARYNDVDVFRPRWNVHLERDAAHGLLRPLVGLQIAKVVVRDYTGRRVEAGDGTALQAPTQLARDAAAGRAVGLGGGWDNTLKLGVAYDTRDYEPNPTRGAFHDASFERSAAWLGSAFTFSRTNVTLRLYHPLVTRATEVTFAWRGLYQVQTGVVPFYELSTLAFTQGDDIGLGGLRTIRGFAELRFIGPVAALTNAELRWTLGETSAWGQRFGFMLSPFVDAGRVFDRVADTTLRRWEAGYGAGARLIWNQATILAVDYGRSREGAGLYVNFQLMF